MFKGEGRGALTEYLKLVENKEPSDNSNIENKEKQVKLKTSFFQKLIEKIIGNKN